MGETIVRAVHGGEVLSVRLPRDVPAVSALGGIGRDLTGQVRAVVLSSQTDQFVGDDATAGVATADLCALADAVSWLRRPDLISIAAVRGHAFGVGLQVALACDFRVLAEGAELAVTEVVGGAPAFGSAPRLVELAGPSVALELMITGRRVSAAHAVAYGLANLVVPEAELEAAVDDLVQALLAPPREAVIEAKALVASSARGAAVGRS